MVAKRSCIAVLIGCCAAAVLAACGPTRMYQPPGPGNFPPGIAGTVGEFADLVGANPMLVRGYGVVVGLGQNGSREVPPALRKHLISYMLKLELGSPTKGTHGLSPARMLDDKDTAVVVVAGWMPPGAPVGTRFDLQVEALPQTQTLSLAGGTLMPAELQIAIDTAGPAIGRAKSWASGRGDIFTSPFIGAADKSQQVKLRAGRLVGGGEVTRERPIRLELRRPEYPLATLVKDLINEHFGAGQRVANATSCAIVELNIPPAWRRDYEHFLELVLHLYVRGADRQERHARELAEVILLPTARCDDISLVWEAMGRNVLPILQPLYSSAHPAAAFYATRAGLRLGDPLAVGPMIRIAEQANSPFEILAVRELGRAYQFVQPVAALKRMLSSSNHLLRVAAYEALLDRNCGTAIQRTKIGEQFVLDVVDSEQDYVVYATCTGQPRIVLFGRNMAIRRPIFHCPPDELVTINASTKDEKIMVQRKIPRTGGVSDPFYVEPRVDELAKTLGWLPIPTPKKEIKGLGLTYSQVVGVLYDLCENGHVPAKFVLQPGPQMQRIYMLTPAVGRPDAPEE